MKHIFLNWKTNRFLLHFSKKSNQTIHYRSKNIDFLFHLSKNTQNKKHYIQNLKSRVKRNSRVTIYRRAFTKKKKVKQLEKQTSKASILRSILSSSQLTKYKYSSPFQTRTRLDNYSNRRQSIRPSRCMSAPLLFVSLTTHSFPIDNTFAPDLLVKRKHTRSKQNTKGSKNV